MLGCEGAEAQAGEVRGREEAEGVIVGDLVQGLRGEGQEVPGAAGLARADEVIAGERARGLGAKCGLHGGSIGGTATRPIEGP